MTLAVRLGLVIAGTVAVVLLVVGLSGVQWLWEERAALLDATRVTTTRLITVITAGLMVGVSLARVMRLSTFMEARLTPWVLAFLSVPWLLVMIAINLIPSLGLSEVAATTVAAAAFAVQIWALGRRKLEESREVYVRRAFTYAFVAVMAGELLARTDGLGAQIRFFTLFTQLEHVVVYAALLVVVSVLLVPVERVMLRVARRSFLLQG